MIELALRKSTSNNFDNTQNLIEQQNQKTHQIFKNRLFLTSILNAIVFLVFIFAMLFYNWATVGVPLQRTYSQIKNPHASNVVYFDTNLLYAKNLNTSQYQSFPQIIKQLCPPSDYYCSQMMQSLRFTGVVCFILFLAGSTFQMYDIVRTIIYLFTAQKYQDEGFTQSKQDNLRHIITIALFIVGITLNIFSMAVMDIYFRYGISFWIFIAGLVCFILLIIYQQLSLQKLQKQKMVLALIQNQKKVAHKMNMDFDISSQNGQTYI